MGGQLGEGLGKQNDRVGLIVTVTEGLCVMPNLLSVSPPSIQLPTVQPPALPSFLLSIDTSIHLSTPQSNHPSSLLFAVGI